MDQHVIHVLDDPAALYQAAAEEAPARISAAVRARGSCAVARSGGSTPRGLHLLLADDGPVGSRASLGTASYAFWGLRPGTTRGAEMAR